MRKRTIIFATALSATVLFTACNQPNSSSTTHSDSTATVTAAATQTAKRISPKLLPPHDGPYSQFIPIDSANKMLLSYLNSINYQGNDSDLQCIVFDANQVRKMLADPTISNIKIMFAHSLDYINNGGQNIPCGYTAKEFTVIISGYNQKGNYVYNPTNTVLEIGSPCPPNCVTEGTASRPLLTPAVSNETKK